MLRPFFKGAARRRPVCAPSRFARALVVLAALTASLPAPVRAATPENGSFRWRKASDSTCDPGWERLNHQGTKRAQPVTLCPGKQIQRSFAGRAKR